MSAVYNNSRKVVWKSTGADNEIVSSNPPCADENGNLLSRVCINGTWFPQGRPVCANTINTSRRCPKNMIENAGTCVFISQLKVWEEKCKHVGGVGNLYDSLGNELTWLPVKRKVKYGAYESVTSGKDYGHPLNSGYKLLYKADDFFKKDCLAASSEGEKMLPVYCTEKHIFVCPVNEDEMDCPENCISAGIATQKCFCKRKDEDCSQLAQINSPSDKITLSKLADEENCMLGDSFTTDPSLLGFKQSLNRNIWSLTRQDLSCSLCVEPLEVAVGDVEMVLQFTEKNNSLYLTIYSSEGLYKNNDDDFIYCFTDASKELKKRVKIRKIHETYQKAHKISYYYVKLEKYIGFYWCEASKKGTKEPVFSNKVLAYQVKTGNEYSLRLFIKDICEIFNCSLKGGTLDFSQFVDGNNLKLLKHGTAEVRAMEVFSFDFKTLDILLHLTTKNSHHVETEFIKLYDTIKGLAENFEIVYFRNSEYCLSETNYSLSWQLTKIGEVAVPTDPCLLSTNSPVHRVCSGDFMYGSQWDNPNGECHKNMSESTRYIYSVLEKNISTTYIEDIGKFTKLEKLTVLGYYYLTKVLRKISNYNFSFNETYEVFQNTFEITNNLMTMDSQTLLEAQKELNVTDEIIDALEDFAGRWSDSEDFLIQDENVILHIANPFVTNTTGMKMFLSNNQIYIENFKRNVTYDNVNDEEHLQFAYYAPNNLLDEIPEEKRNTLRLITTVFLKPHFFPANSNTQTGPIVSIIIQGLESYLPSPIPVWFKAASKQDSPTCAFWDYGKRTNRHKGNWSATGGTYMGRLRNGSSLHVCSFSHLTHFSLLVANASIAIGSTDEYVLNIITITGDVLSLFGIGGIIATAIIFKNWRRKPGTKILLNLSIAISFEIIGMFLIQFQVVNSNNHCQVLGPLLHYLILCKHFWMLVYAFLQYNRFVKVLAAIPNNVVLKSVIFGWGFATIPVVFVCAINPYTYSINNHNFCYPRNWYLYLGVYLPITLIIILNTVVFFIVMRNISSTVADPYINKMDSRTQKLQLKLAALLFFVLGLPILFGLLANLIETVWLQLIVIYIFCLTSNVQGFILFIFYVILNKETRYYWITYTVQTMEKSLSTTTTTRSKSSKSRS